MRRRARRTGWWSSSGKHFRYDLASRCYVSDNRIEPHDGERRIDRFFKAQQDDQVYYAMFLEVLGEFRREFEIEPANEWEGGHLLTLYGTVKAAAAPVEAAREKDDDWWHDPAEVRRRHLLERFLAKITYICEIVVIRHWPDALSRLAAEMADNSPRKIDRLNLAARQVGLHDISRLRTVVDVWLSGSFDRPDIFSRHRGMTDPQLERSSAWMEACLDGVRQILSTAGPAIESNDAWNRTGKPRPVLKEVSIQHHRMKAPRQSTESGKVEAVLADIRSALREKKRNTTDIGSIIALYGSIMSLCARAKRVRAIITANSREGPEATVQLDCMAPTEVREFSGFFDELLEFGEYLNVVSIAVIDIFYPGLKDELMEIVGRDVDFSGYYTQKLAPKYGLVEEALPLTLFNFLDRFDGDWGPRNSGEHLMMEFDAQGSSRWGDYYRGTPTAVFVANFMNVSAGLERCRNTISQIVKDHWDFRDLTTPSAPVSVSIEGDLSMSETRYDVNHSQVGAIGPNAHVHDVQFCQMLERAGRSVDTSALAKELDQLKAELAELASDRDHYAALVAISDAAVDAKAGNGVGALAKLAAAGNWALDVATKIGVSVAAEAIKVAIGLK